MADIVLRNLDASLKEKLRQTAAKNNRPMNAELLDIVQTALTRPRHGTTAGLKKLAAVIRLTSCWFPT